LIDGSEKVLSYKSQERRVKSPDPLAATLLCVPGVACWVLFFGVFLWKGAGSGKFGFIEREWFSAVILLWIVAVASAIFSIIHYRKMAKPVYVRFCLLVNWAGIVFTLSPLGWISFWVLTGPKLF
jgi:hypothetical protein